MNDDMIFDDDEEFGFESVEEPIKEEPKNEVDLTTEVLRLKGIEDPSKIKFEDELGTIVEKDWNELSRAEQLNILTSLEKETVENQFDDSEIQLINSIRESGMSIDDYLKSLVPDVPIQKYEVDSLSDEDMYALDMLHKVEDITDEEISAAVELAKQNEPLFKKTVEGLRKEYKRLQEESDAEEANRAAYERENAFNKFASSILNEIYNFNTFGGLDLTLSNDDIEDLSAFILDLDDNGVSPLGKALNDPAILTKAAFWILNEDKIAEELSKLIKESYNRGYEKAKLETRSKLAFKPTSQKKTTDDVFIDDEDFW